MFENLLDGIKHNTLSDVNLSTFWSFDYRNIQNERELNIGLARTTVQVLLPENRLAVAGSVRTGRAEEVIHQIRIIDLDNGECIKILEGHTNVIRALALLPNGDLISGGIDQTIRRWNLQTGECLQIYKGHRLDVNFLLPISNDQFISTSEDRMLSDRHPTARIWAVDVESSLKTFTVVSTTPQTSSRARKPQRVNERIRFPTVILDQWFAANVYYRLGGGADQIGNSIRVWDINTGEKVRDLVPSHRKSGSISIWSLIALSQGRIACGCSWTIPRSGGRTLGSIFIWDVKTGALIHELLGHQGYVQALLEIPGGFLASGGSGDDHNILIWNLQSGRCVRKFEGHTNGIRDLIMLEDGRHLASISLDKTLRIWDISSQKCLSIIPIQSSIELQPMAILQKGRIITPQNILEIPRIPINQEEILTVLDSLVENTSVETLNLSKLDCSEVIEQLIEVLETNTTLTSIDMSHTNLTDESLQQLIQVLRKNNDTLMYINVDGNELSPRLLNELNNYLRRNRGEEVIREVLEVPLEQKLQMIHYITNRDVESIDQLTQENPHLLVVPLLEGQTLLHLTLSCHKNDLDFLREVLELLGEDIFLLRDKYPLSTFMGLAAKHSGAKGVKLIMQAFDIEIREQLDSVFSVMSAQEKRIQNLEQRIQALERSQKQEEVPSIQNIAGVMHFRPEQEPQESQNPETELQRKSALDL